jgi:membrane fusion protein, multidrug efflux system
MNAPNAVSCRPISFARRSRSGGWRALAWTACVIVLGASACGKHELSSGAADQQGPPQVSVITVQPRDVPVTFEFVAQTQSSRQVNIQARVSGFLEKRVYTEGSVVKEGDTLFVMDQKPFLVSLDNAKAALAKQEAALDVARRDLDRVKPLAAANALSQKDLDDAVGQFQSASAAVEQAKASVQQAEINLGYTVITSPVDGITGAAAQQDGTYLSFANSQLTTVAVITPMYVNFSISENDRLWMRDQVAGGLVIPPKGQKYVVEIVLVDGSVYPHTGQVTFAEPSFNAQTGTFMLRVTIDNPDRMLLPNQYVRVRLKGGVRPNAILVPQRAVMQGAKGHFVWVVDAESKAQQRPVTVGEWNGDDWFISEGLNAGEQVVVGGGLRLQPATVVKTVPATDQATAPAAAATPQTGSN